MKLAKEFDVEPLLPPGRKSTVFKDIMVYEKGLRIKGTGIGEKVKGHKWERTLNVRLEERRKAMLNMPEMIRAWKQVSNFPCSSGMLVRWVYANEFFSRSVDMEEAGRSIRRNNGQTTGLVGTQDLYLYNGTSMLDGAIVYLIYLSMCKNIRSRKIGLIGSFTGIYFELHVLSGRISGSKIIYACPPTLCILLQNCHALGQNRSMGIQQKQIVYIKEDK